MKIVQAQRIESVRDYQIVEQAIPEPQNTQIRLKIIACGMGYVDALVALGRYQVKPPVPFTPGQEIAGIVDAIGQDVRTLKVGDRIMTSAFGGGLAEYGVVPEANAQRIPDTMGFAEAAGFRVNYLTALHGLRDRAALQSGERLLVFGAAGGVGAAAVQVGKLMGATVIAAASSEQKRAFATSVGADRTIDTSVEGWRDRLKQVCDGKSPDVIFDPVCGPLFEAAFRSLSWNGRHLVVGFTGGPIPALPINLSLMKGAALVGVDVRQFGLFEADHAQGHLTELLGWVEAGNLKPPVGRRFPFRAFGDAMEFALSGSGMGKTIIDVQN